MNPAAAGGSMGPAPDMTTKGISPARAYRIDTWSPGAGIEVQAQEAPSQVGVLGRGHLIETLEDSRGIEVGMIEPGVFGQGRSGAYRRFHTMVDHIGEEQTNPAGAEGCEVIEVATHDVRRAELDMCGERRRHLEPGEQGILEVAGELEVGLHVLVLGLQRQMGIEKSSLLTTLAHQVANPKQELFLKERF